MLILDVNRAFVDTFFSVCSCHKRKHLVLSDHGDEHGERDVSDLSAPVPGLVPLILGKVKPICLFHTPFKLVS